MDNYYEIGFKLAAGAGAFFMLWVIASMVLGRLLSWIIDTVFERIYKWQERRDRK